MVRAYGSMTRLEMEGLDRKRTIVVLPVAAMEQHGNQAPLGTDFFTAEGLSAALSAALPPQLFVLTLPALPVGLSTEHLHFTGSLSLRPETLYALVYDICKSLAHHGFEKILFLNCHGGNAPVLQLLSRELRQEFGLACFISKNDFGAPAIRATVTEGNRYDFHGGEMETGLMMHLRPDDVRLSTARAGRPRHSLGTHTVSIGWISEDYIDDDGAPIGIGGDPAGATAEKGRIIFESLLAQLVEGLCAIDGFTNELARL